MGNLYTVNFHISQIKSEDGWGRVTIWKLEGELKHAILVRRVFRTNQQRIEFHHIGLVIVNLRPGSVRLCLEGGMKMRLTKRFVSGRSWNSLSSLAMRKAAWAAILDGEPAAAEERRGWVEGGECGTSECHNGVGRGFGGI